MKIIEILHNKTDGDYNEMIGHYRVLQEGLDDIVIIKNYEYREIKEVETITLGVKSKKYTVQKIINYDRHIVKPLETLESISEKYGVDINDIKNKNNLASDKLFIGQIINL